MRLTQLTWTFSSSCAFLFFQVLLSIFVFPQELQRLEQSNSTLHKEIAALKKELHFYETSLERHKPYCRFRDSSSSDSKDSPRSPQASKSSSASLSTSITPTTGFQTFSYTRQTHFTSSASAPASTARPTPAVSSSSPSASSNPPIAPYSVPLSTQPALHSLFCEPPQIAYVNVEPVHPSLVSDPVPSSATRLPSGMLHKNPPVTESSCLAGDTFPMKQVSSLTASSKMQPLLSGLGTENTPIVKQDGSMNAPQLYSCRFGRSFNGTHSPLRPPPPQYPGPQTLSVQTQAGLVPSPSTVSHQQRVSSSPESLLSLLTVPSPLSGSQTTSSNSNRMVSQPTQSLPPLPDPSKDYSLSELLEINDWIFSGVSYQ